MKKNASILWFMALIGFINLPSMAQTGLWMKYEKSFESAKTYENPLYNIARFRV